MKQQFYAISNFPHVFGAIDCTRIQIAFPGGDDSGKFVNRKGVYSINEQVTCDANKKITNIVARLPVSTHDSRSVQESVIDIRRHTHHGHNIGGGIPDICQCVLFENTIVNRGLGEHTDEKFNWNQGLDWV